MPIPQRPAIQQARVRSIVRNGDGIRQEAAAFLAIRRRLRRLRVKPRHAMEKRAVPHVALGMIVFRQSGDHRPGLQQPVGLGHQNALLKF